MSSPYREPWLWIIVFSLILIIVLPFAIIWFILTLPPELSFTATIIIIVMWGVAAGYKDWTIQKRKDEEKQRKASEGF